MNSDRVNLELPFARSWWIDPGRIIGGRFPGTTSAAESKAMLARLLDVGVRTVINLQGPSEPGAGGKPFPDYSHAISALAADRGLEVEVHRFPIPDMGVPTAGQMQQILDAIEHGVSAGHRVYVHCWGGHGRTGTVAGCWLVQRGTDCSAALRALEQARRHDVHLMQFPAPQTEEQRQFVRSWRRAPKPDG
jgi:hypothetical protein